MRKLLRASLVALGLVGLSAAAHAEDGVGSAIHGFVDASIKNAYITPRGLLVHDTGVAMQILSGLAVNVYQNPAGTLNTVTITGGVWNDLWTKQNDPNNGDWNEFDWFIGISAVLDQKWKVGVQYIPFVSPPKAFRTERNIEFSASYSDTPSAFGLSFNPYAKLFWNVDGDSTVVTGDGGGTFDVEIGMVPTLDLAPHGIAATISMPTWITVGPEDYWGGNQNVGVFSTGLTVKAPFTFIPVAYGKWYGYVGGQYYRIINDQLKFAQTLTGADGTGRRNVGLVSLGIGFSF